MKTINAIVKTGSNHDALCKSIDILLKVCIGLLFVLINIGFFYA